MQREERRLGDNPIAPTGDRSDDLSDRNRNCCGCARSLGNLEKQPQSISVGTRLNQVELIMRFSPTRIPRQRMFQDASAICSPLRCSDVRAWRCPEHSLRFDEGPVPLEPTSQVRLASPSDAPKVFPVRIYRLSRADAAIAGRFAWNIRKLVRLPFALHSRTEAN